MLKSRQFLFAVVSCLREIHDNKVDLKVLRVLGDVDVLQQIKIVALNCCFEAFLVLH